MKYWWSTPREGGGGIMKHIRHTSQEIWARKTDISDLLYLQQCILNPELGIPTSDPWGTINYGSGGIWILTGNFEYRIADPDPGGQLITYGSTSTLKKGRFFGPTPTAHTYQGYKITIQYEVYL